MTGSSSLLCCSQRFRLEVSYTVYPSHLSAILGTNVLHQWRALALVNICGIFSRGNYTRTSGFVRGPLFNVQPLANSTVVYISWSTYTIVLGLIKVSLVIFYLEIFPSQRARIVSYIILAYIVINTLVIFFLTIFNCIPVRAFWNRNVKDAKCMDINALAYANSGSAIVQDVILLIYPLVLIRKLNMKLYRKIAVGLMFSIGTLYVRSC